MSSRIVWQRKNLGIVTINWSKYAQHDGYYVMNQFQFFLKILDPIIVALEEIHEWTDTSVVAEANGILKAIQDPEFLLAVHCINTLFCHTILLCRALQKVNQDMVQALILAEDAYDTILEIRKNADCEFNKIFNMVQKKVHSYNMIISMPRIGSRQVHRNNISTQSVEEYYKITIFIPLMDTFLTQIKERVLNHKLLLNNLQILLSSNPSMSISDDIINKIRYLYNFYFQDMVGSELEVIAEFKYWYANLKRMDIKPDNALNICKHTLIDFPNITKFFQILACLPIMTCTNERTFPNLRRLKTYLGNTTSQNRLNGLALLNIHRELTPANSEIINELSNSKRKLDLTL
ncbi:52 kDa repressor of the inhibitor of the protein kinase-like [Gordionus sp. m RMFG-2023]|uniref:52 kDa repressor of the inhibitor of the protein kinase-like n=1 Tax=Gordionus sp. m RMFG-2023 TaxID=3053472 RepID=UPI0031FD996C